MVITRVMYISDSSGFNDPESLAELAARSAESNRLAGITGVLLKTGNIFFQVLEAEELVVNDILEKISNDKRHDNMRIIGREQTFTRAFGQWNMGCLNLDDDYAIDETTITLLKERVQIIVQQQRNSKARLKELIETLPALLEKNADGA